ncbi:MAG: hypothetical protein GX858_06185, partial [Clostridiales bacterium]|nr:hypothetical protein [Clostridiales bacterium]
MMQRDSQDYFDIKEEKKQTRRDRLMLAAGMSNFFSVIAGSALILLL